MKKAAYTILFTLLFTLCSFLACQERGGERARHRGNVEVLKISGRVVSMEGKPLPGAVILLPETGAVVESDAQGVFLLTGLVKGRYHLEIHREGYESYRSEPFSLVGDLRFEEISLVSSIKEEIVVTATQTARLHMEVPIKTDVVSREKIENKGATQLAESLTGVTGVRVENNCQNCNTTQVRINGMEGKYSQILIDSVPFFSSLVGVYGLEQLPSEMVERVEVVKGGGGAIYGGSAVAGVVNVITKEPWKNRLTLKYQQESIQGEPGRDFGLSGGVVSSQKSSRFLFYATHKRRDAVDLNDDGFSELGSLRDTNVGATLFQDFPSLEGKLRFNLFHLDENRRGGNRFDRPPHEADVAEAIESHLTGATLDWNQSLAQNLFYTLTLSYLDARRSSYYGSGQDPNAYGKTQNPVYYGAFQLNRSMGTHLFSIGFQGRRETLEDQALGYGRNTDDRYGEYGLFFQDDFKVGTGVSVLAGVRMTKHTLLENLLFHPRLGVLINLTSDLGWRASLSTGFRAPQVFDEDLHITQVGGQGVIIRNSDKLKEESSLSLSSGLDYGHRWGAGLLRGSVEFFHTKLVDTFVLNQRERDTLSNALIFERVNGGESQVSGASWEGSYRLDGKGEISFGITLQRSRLKEPEPDFGTRRFFRSPNLYGFASLTAELGAIGEAELSLDLTGPMKVPHYRGWIEEDRLENSPWFYDLSLRYRREVSLGGGRSLKVTLSCFNLLDSRQKDLDRGALRDSGYVYGPARPRTFSLAGEFNF